MEQTLAIIKPDAVQDGRISDIIHHIEAYRPYIMIVEMHMLTLTTAEARTFYTEHAGKEFFENLIAFTCSGPLVAMVLAGPDVVNRWRGMMGRTDPRDCRLGDLRQTYGKGMPNNAVHGSDSVQSATIEIQRIHTFVKEALDARRL